jgi:hypothetical protein
VGFLFCIIFYNLGVFKIDEKNVAKSWQTVFEITENIELMRVCGYSCNPSGITEIDF